MYEAERMTPEAFLDRLLVLPRGKQLQQITALWSAAEQGQRCLTADHEGTAYLMASATRQIHLLQQANEVNQRMAQVARDLGERMVAKADQGFDGEMVATQGRILLEALDKALGADHG